MKKFSILTLLPFIFVLCLVPHLADAKSYILSDGDAFEGTEQEYKYAELLLKIQNDIPTITTQVWNKVSKKYKFPTTSKILSTVKFTGDAGYNPVTREYYLSNANGGGKIVIQIKHKFSRKKIEKITDSFLDELDKVLTKYETDAKVTSPKKIKEGSDLDDVASVLYDHFYDVGSDLGISTYRSFITLKGQTNKKGVQPILMSSFLGKNGTISEAEKGDMYIELTPNFTEDLYFELESQLYKTSFINIEIDEAADTNTKVTFKIEEIRQLTSLKPADIWPSLFEVEI